MTCSEFLPLLYINDNSTFFTKQNYFLFIFRNMNSDDNNNNMRSAPLLSSEFSTSLSSVLLLISAPIIPIPTIHLSCHFPINFTLNSLNPPHQISIDSFPPHIPKPTFLFQNTQII